MEDKQLGRGSTASAGSCLALTPARPEVSPATALVFIRNIHSGKLTYRGPVFVVATSAGEGSEARADGWLLMMWAAGNRAHFVNRSIQWLMNSMVC